MISGQTNNVPNPRQAIRGRWKAVSSLDSDEFLLMLATAVFGLVLLIPTFLGHFFSDDRYLFAVILLISVAIKPRRYLIPWPLLAWVLAFFLPFLIGYLAHYNMDPFWASLIRKYMSQSSTALIVIVFYWVHLRNWRGVKVVLVTLLITAVISDVLRMGGALGIVGVGEAFISKKNSMRLRLGADFNTSTAFTLATVAYFGVFIRSRRNLIHRAFTYTFLALAFITAALSGSRSGLLSLGITLFVVLLLSLKGTSRSAKRETLLFLLFLIVAGVTAYIVYYKYFATIVERFTDIGSRSTGLRTGAIKWGLKSFFSGIYLTGPGPIPYSQELGDFHAIDPHNVMAGFFAIGGQPLVIVLGFWWFEAFLNTFRLASKDDPSIRRWGVFLMGMLVGEFILINSNPHFFTKLFWLTPAVAIRLPFLPDPSKEPVNRLQLAQEGRNFEASG